MRTLARRHRVFVVMSLMLFAAPCFAQRVHVDAPKVRWAKFKPYVHANIAPYLKEQEFSVYVCEGATCTFVAEPFDKTLSDFAKVLLLQRAMGDEKFATAVHEITEAFRARLPGLTPSERERYREIFWASLDADPYITSTIREDYQRARKSGRVRCYICELDPTFKPEGLRVEESAPASASSP